MAPREIELKFGLTDAALAALSSHPALADPGETASLQSVYYDTPKQDLRAAGFSLRVRADGVRFVQTLKLEGAAGPFDRAEWEWPLPDQTLDLSLLADTPAPRDLKAKGVCPVFEMRVERTRRLWRAGENTVEIAIDRGAVEAGGETEPLFEMELELKAGDPGALSSLADTLAGDLGLRLTFESKAARGYRLAGGEGGTVESRDRGVDPHGSAADALRQAAFACLVQIAENAGRVEGERDREALHQTRVGLRRLRAVFSAFKPLTAGTDVEALKREARWLAGELDAARNLDVFIAETFRPAEPALDDHRAYAAFGAALEARRGEAYDRAAAAIGSSRYAALLLAVARWAMVGDWTVDDAALAEQRDRPAADFAIEQMRRLHHKVAKGARRFDRLDAEGRHKLRIHAKTLRYAAEFFARCLGHPKAQRRYARRLKVLQDDLGALNDAAGVRGLARDIAGRSTTPDLHYVAGVLAGARQQGLPTAIERAGKRLSKFARLQLSWS